MKKSFLLMFAGVLLVAGCSGTPYDEYDFANGGPNAPMYNEPVGELMTANNPYANIDSYKPKTDVDIEQESKRWNTARKETRWQEYKGAMVRVEILLGNTDVREMRLRLMQNADGMDVDGDARTILAAVADFEMKRVCGRNADSIVMVYDKPSFEAMRPTPYFEYRIEAEGVTMREYGFRCVYR